ncbi:hypothetical protein ACLBKS_02455 [Hylemonella sp. W303a]|uniref:hypothetical protein n=1 Tax=Hylemonella sp. W303a TaxID=3389873 RepID=UPI00396B09F9
MLSDLFRSWSNHLAASPLRWLLRITSLLLLALCGLHVGYTLRAQGLNPVPESAADVARWPIVPIEVLHVLEGPDAKIAWLANAQPALNVRLADDTQQSMEFPVPLTWPGRRSTVLDDAALRKLPGCMGYVRGQFLQGLGTAPRFRIWELHCGPVHHAYEDFKAAYDAARSEGPAPARWQWGVLAMLLLVGVLAWVPWHSRRPPSANV